VSRQAERAQKRAQSRFVTSLQHTMRHALGRQLVWELLDRTGLHGNLMANNAGTTSWLIGRRDIGLELLRDLKEHTFAEYRLMEDEAIARQKREDLERAPPAGDEPPDDVD
jgi:hypothetical protein